MPVQRDTFVFSINFYSDVRVGKCFKAFSRRGQWHVYRLLMLIFRGQNNIGPYLEGTLYRQGLKILFPCKEFHNLFRRDVQKIYAYLENRTSSSNRRKISKVRFVSFWSEGQGQSFLLQHLDRQKDIKVAPLYCVLSSTWQNKQEVICVKERF